MNSRLVDAMTSGVETFCRAGIDFLYPRACPLCGQRDLLVCGNKRIAPVLCGVCRRNVAPVIEHSCRRCGAPVGPHLDTAAGCVHCRRDRFGFERVFCLGVYDGGLRHACLRPKRPGGEPIAAALAMLLWEREQDRLRDVGPDIVVPLPQHWTSRFFRRHNASETLARAVGRCLQVTFSRHILAKVRMTPPQSRLPSSRRRENLRGAFRVRGASSLRGATVLVVDDILTTGATANEASRVLRQAGAERVYVAVIARGIGR